MPVICGCTLAFPARQYIKANWKFGGFSWATFPRVRPISYRITIELSDNDFIALLLANQSRVYRFLFTLVPRREDVEDLLQKTCLTLWQERAKFDPKKGEFASWACAIAQNHVRNFRRRESTRQTLLSEEVAELLMSTREAGHRLSEECHLAMQHCLNLLPPHQMALIEESYRENAIKNSAAASLMGG